MMSRKITYRNRRLFQFRGIDSFPSLAIGACRNFRFSLKGPYLSLKFFPYWGIIGFSFGFRVRSTAQAGIFFACEKISSDVYWRFFELLTGFWFRNILSQPQLRKNFKSMLPKLNMITERKKKKKTLENKNGYEYNIISAEKKNNCLWEPAIFPI